MITMLEIQVQNKDIEELIEHGGNKIKFTSNNLICEKMRVKFFCNGVCGKTYIEGFIQKILSKQKVIDNKGFEYNCEIFPDLILF